MAPVAAAVAAVLLAAGLPAVAAGEPLARGDICYRFCEDGSQPFVNRRADCPADAPCRSTSEAVGFDSCGARAQRCGGAEASPSFLSVAAAAVEEPAPEVEARALQTTVDCLVDPDNLHCCELEPEAPCLIKNIVKEKDGCTVACQRRYQTLGYTCYLEYSPHFRWQQMMKNCDPTGAFEWRAPTTTKPPQSMNADVRPDRIGLTSGALPAAPGLAALAAAALAARA